MKKTILFASVALLMAACSQEEGPSENRQMISFSTQVEQPSENDPGKTRGSIVSSAALLPSFGVSAQVYGATEGYATQGLGNYFYNLECQKDKATSQIWPEKSKKMSFFAYAPYDCAGLTISAKGTTGVPTYTYTVPENILNQEDFMTAQAVDISCASPTTVTLPFKHRMTDIRFSIKNRSSNYEVTVNKISIIGVKYTGNYKTSWTLSGDANSLTSHPFTYTFNKAVAAKATVDITGSLYHFIMLPQTVASGTNFIVIETTQSGTTKTYTHKLTSALTLEEGKSYTFNVELGEGDTPITFNATVDAWTTGTQSISFDD